MMKLIILVLFSLIEEVWMETLLEKAIREAKEAEVTLVDKSFHKLFEKVGSCKEAIHSLRDNEDKWYMTCFNEDKNENYLCNQAPSAPEQVSTHPKYDH